MSRRINSLGMLAAMDASMSHEWNRLANDAGYAIRPRREPKKPDPERMAAADAKRERKAAKLRKKGML